MSSAHQFRCMCCKDSGILPDYIVRKYVASHQSHGLDNSAEPPFLCQACDNIYAQVQTNRGLQFLPKMPLEWTNRSLNVNDCRAIHLAETALAAAEKAISEPSLQPAIDDLAKQKAMKGKSKKRAQTAAAHAVEIDAQSSIDDLELMQDLGLVT